VPLTHAVMGVPGIPVPGISHKGPVSDFDMGSIGLHQVVFRLTETQSQGSQAKAMGTMIAIFE